LNGKKGDVRKIYFILSIFFFISCSSISPVHELGIKQYNSADYESANMSLEAARKDSPNNVELLLLLTNTKYQLAKANLGAVDSLQKYDIPGKIEKIKLSQEQLTAGISYFHAAESKIKENEELSKKVNISESESLLKEVEQKLSKLTEDQERLLEKSNKLKETVVNSQDPEKTYLEFQTIAPYQQYYGEVKEAYVKIQEVFYKFLSDRGWNALNNSKKDNKNRIKDAKFNFQKIVQYSEGNSPEYSKLGKEGILSVDVFELYNQKKWLDSYKKLREIKELNSKSPYIEKYKSLVIINLIQEVHNELKLAKKENKISLAMKALDDHIYLSDTKNIDELTDVQKEGIQVGIKELRVLISHEFISIVHVLKSKENIASADALILNLLRWAYKFDPNSAKKLETLAEEVFKSVHEKGILKDMIFVKSARALQAGSSLTTNSVFEFEDQIRHQLVDNFKAEEWPPQYSLASEKSILTTDYLFSLNNLSDLSKSPYNKNQTLKDYDLITWISIEDFRVEEYGFNQPIIQNSKYVAGTKSVDNPEWFTAQQELLSAQQEYNGNYAQTQQMLNNCNNMGNAISVATCRGAVTGISTAKLDDAKNKANSVPRYLQEKIINDYSYRYFKVGLNISIKSQIQSLELKNNIISASQLVEYQLKNKEGEIYDGVMNDDVNGLKNQKINVPETASEKQNGENLIIESFKKEMQKMAIDKQGMRYCHEGKRLKKDVMKNKKSIYAFLNKYQLCFYIKKNSDLDKEEKEEFLEGQNDLSKFYQTTPQVISSFKFEDSTSTDKNSPWTIPESI
jgi:hypothetical protein